MLVLLLASCNTPSTPVETPPEDSGPPIEDADHPIEDADHPIEDADHPIEDADQPDVSRDDTGVPWEPGHEVIPPRLPLSRYDLPWEPGHDLSTPPLQPGDLERIPGLCNLVLDCSVDIPNEPKIPCQLQVTDDEGVLWYEGPAGVELRGRSSLSFPKHQYAVELWDDTGAEVAADLLGFGAEEDWVVNGAWIDRVLMRNQFGFDTFRGMGGWAPQSAACTLTLDGTWLGIYFLSERPRRGESRMDFPSSDSGDGFIAVLDDGTGAVDFSAVGHGTWRLVYPREESASEEQIAGASAWLLGWITSLQAEDLSDPETGVFAWVDQQSAIDFVLLEELVKNNDAFYLSVFVWKEPGGLLQFSPWDLDLSLGQPIYNNNVPPEEWIRYRPAWVSRMASVPGFREALVARWWELRAGLLSDEQVLERIELMRATLGDTVYDNFDVWPIEEIQFARDQLPLVSSYDEEYERVRDWLPARLAWIDDNIADW